MRKKRNLQIKISYELNRLAETNLSNAYEKLIPTIKYPISVKEKEKEKEKNNDTEMNQKLNIKGDFKW